jgi:hypothetical protein
MLIVLFRINPSEAQQLLYVPPGLTLKHVRINSAHRIYEFFVVFIAIITLRSIN